MGVPAGMRKTARRKPWPSDAALDKPKYGLDDYRLFAQSVVSPLRYPGAKRRLYQALQTIINANVPPPRLFIEPFCGSATSALRLVGTGVVEHAIIAESPTLFHAKRRCSVWHG